VFELIPYKALKQIEHDLNEDIKAEIIVIYNYRGHRWVNPQSTTTVRVGDEIVINFNGINVEEYNDITNVKKWWQFWK
jgi:hypothetical protein